MRDNWCVGFSRRYTVGVWVGNFSGEPMHDVSGVSGAAPAWLEIMTFLHRGRPDERPDAPASLVHRRIELPPEPARDEWFLPGTEPAASRVAIAEARARITQPTDGSLFAIDPDIPSANQRMALEASGARGGTRWSIDGRDLGEAGELRLWPPEPGRHHLALVEPDGRTLDQVAFEVRSPGR